MWKTLNEKKLDSIHSFVKEAAKEGYQVHVGTDSLQTGKYTQFVTVVAILGSVAGRAENRAAYKRLVLPRIQSLRERLLKEVWLSVELGLELDPLVPGELTIHVDANPALKYKSSKYVQELTGFVVGNGFQCKIKPEAFVASTCADHIVRYKGKLPEGFAA